jgi:hypothetical protein
LRPVQLDDQVVDEQACRGLGPLRNALKKTKQMNSTAHITSQGDSIHAMLSTGEIFTGTLDEITDLLRSRGIAAADITMPNKNDDESPTTGQRIAIHHALHCDEI